MLAQNQPQEQLSPLDHKKADLLASAKKRGNVAKQSLILAEDGCYSASEIINLLRIDQNQLDYLQSNDRLIGLPVDNTFVYPKWQLVKKFWLFHEILPGLDKVLDALGDCSPWTKAAFMLDEHIRTEFPTPLAGLLTGNVEMVLSAAKAFRDQGAS
jgi:hypothetical protein